MKKYQVNVTTYILFQHKLITINMLCVRTSCGLSFKYTNISSEALISTMIPIQNVHTNKFIPIFEKTDHGDHGQGHPN